MSGYKIAIMGASGLVGRKMLQVLEERQFPVRQLILLATERSAGIELTFGGEKIPVQVTQPDHFIGCDLALFSAGSEASCQLAPEAVKRDCLVVDNSNAWRMDKSVPLIVPEVNPEELDQHQGIIANPNCSTIQMVVALQPLRQKYGLERIIVSTYQAVSGTGWAAVEELKEVSTHILNQKSPRPEVYPYPIGFNVLPQIDTFENGYTREELKMVNETRKIYQEPALEIGVTTVRVPVFYGHSESIYVELKQSSSVPEIRQLLKKAPGVVLYDNPERLEYPMPIMVEESDQVWVGRVRQDLGRNTAFQLWVVANNLRKGAATNAVQICEELMKRGIV